MLVSLTDILRRVPLFIELSASELAGIAAKLTVEKCEAGRWFFVKATRAAIC